MGHAHQDRDFCFHRPYQRHLLVDLAGSAAGKETSSSYMASSSMLLLVEAAEPQFISGSMDRMVPRLRFGLGLGASTKIVDTSKVRLWDLAAGKCSAAA